MTSAAVALYRTGVTFQPEEADKIVTAANRMGYSASGLINELTKRMVVTPESVWPLQRV